MFDKVEMIVKMTRSKGDDVKPTTTFSIKLIDEVLLRHALQP